ncbi:MAG: site-specific integrase [Planctomycetes bacterium]|nr:site-specific integrase [Planctomycetota bacterium]
MAAQRRDVPSYRLHKSSGQAIVTLGGRTLYLGPFESPASRERYERVVGEWRARGRFLAGTRDATGAPADWLSVDDLCAGYWTHATEYYRKDGKPTSELSVLKLAMRYLHAGYGSTRAAAFGPLALKACRERMIAGGLSRSTINGFVARIKQTFRWGVENELVPPSTWEGLRAVRGLVRGRSAARETEPVHPVSDADVEATLPHLPAVVAAMVQVQLGTGMRPAEVVAMRGKSLDRTGKVWIYRPEHHKTEHHGIERVVAIGPRVQAVLTAWLKLDPEAPLFSPGEAEGDRAARRRAARRLPAWPSHDPDVRRVRRGQERREFRETYGVDSYRRAIRRACEDAGIEPWSPNQLRHAAATRIRRELGIEAAQAVLGHRLIETTQVYAEVSRARAVEAMERLG